MSALNLPKPKNTYAGEDELRNTASTPINGTNGDSNGNGATPAAAEDEGEYVAPKPSDRFKEGLIYPPREVRSIIDKTALAISKSPTPSLLEDKIRERQKSDAKFAFMQEDDPFHQYYRYMKERVAEDAEAVRQGTLAPQQQTQTMDEVIDQVGGYEPKPAEFKVDLPGVTAHDLDVLRLTALFHARRGRSFLSSLSIREGRNYQFDFLRPTHSLYGYYNRMVESYQKIMQPPPGMIESLVKETSDPNLKWNLLEDAKKRTEWERGRRKREDIENKEKEAEAAAYNAIDWQDFVTVETIEFTQSDMDLELPPPTSVERLKSMSMAEKRMASMVMEETGAGPTGGDQLLPEGGAAQEEMEMEEDEEEEEAKTMRIKAEQEQARAREVQTAALQSKGIKIRKDYVPKGINRGTTVQTMQCPNCGQSIPENELSEHMRIELLDPKWKEQKRNLDMRRAQQQQMATGADVSASLRNLAGHRTDIFGDDEDETTRRQREEEDARRRKEREKIIWDGHTNSAAKTTDTFQTQFSLDEQIKKMHSNAGLTEQIPANAPGPQAGPGVTPSALPNIANLPPALAASLPKPGGGSAYAGATISAAPTGPITREYISAPPSGPSASGPAIHPSRQAQMGAPPPVFPPPTIGQVHPRDDSDVDRPAFKRPKIEKLPYPQLYSEIDWTSLHPDPIALSVQLPDMPDKPEWKLNGAVILVPDLPVTFTFGTVRERIKRIVDADLPISRLRLDYQGKVMNNGATLASANLDEGDILVMSVRKK